MRNTLLSYRLIGAAGGLLLAAGQFWGPACVLQLVALLPLMILTIRDRRPRWAALAGLYMGLAYTIPQMIYLRIPVHFTAILLVWITIQLILLCMAIATFLPARPVLGSLAVGAAWYILDWVNYTAIPVWGMAQSFARSWTAYPFAIQFISITGISGVVFVVAALQGIAAHIILMRRKHPCQGGVPRPVPSAAEGRGEGVVFAAMVLLIVIINSVIWFEKPADFLKVAAAGWVFHDEGDYANPNEPENFDELFVRPAAEAAAQGARIFCTGELGFYIDKFERDERLEQFAKIARDNDLWLVVGYYNISENENRLFFMSPAGKVVHEYTKSHKTPMEFGNKGTGDLKTVEVDGWMVGAMICQDDNFSKLTRRYGRKKIDLLLSPTADWWTIKNAHLQAVRARAIECNYPIARGAACGISAAISPRGELMAKHDHYRRGPGYVIADIPIHKNRTFFARFGHAPSLAAAAACIGLMLLGRNKKQTIGLRCTSPRQAE